MGDPALPLRELSNAFPKILVLMRYSKSDYEINNTTWTPLAWNSMAGGVNPGKHSVFSFHTVQKLEDKFVTRLVTGYDIKVSANPRDGCCARA